MRRKIVCSGRSVCSRNGSPAAARISWSIRRSSALNSASVSPSRRSRSSRAMCRNWLRCVGPARSAARRTTKRSRSRPQLQQDPFAGEIDRRDLSAVPGADDDERVGGQTADRLMNRCAAEAGHVLQVLHRQQPAGRQRAIDDQILDPLIGEFEEIHAVATAARVSRRH